MAKNFVQPGDVVSIPAPADVLSGAVVIAGELIGVAHNSALAGAPIDLALTGAWLLPKVAANVFAVGGPVYYDPTTGLVTTVSTDNARIGAAIAAAAASTGTVVVRLS